MNSWLVNLSLLALLATELSKSNVNTEQKSEGRGNEKRPVDCNLDDNECQRCQTGR